MVIAGNLTVAEGASLRILGSEVFVDGVITVRPGGLLDVSPEGATASAIGPVGLASQFWVNVEGTMRVAGLPMTTIEGLGGAGLTAAISGVGGIQVSGSLDLNDTRIGSSSAGVVVRESGSLHAQNVIVDATGQIGVAVLGQAHLDSVRIANNTILGLSGRSTCQITATNVIIENVTDGILINSCALTFASGIVQNTAVAVTATGNAKLTLEDSVLEHYSVDGVSASKLPNIPGPELVLTDVTLSADPGAQRGFEFRQAATVTLDGVEVTGHESDGLEALQTRLTVTNSSFLSNGGYGINATGGEALVDLDSTEFGTEDPSKSNRLGALRHEALFTAAFFDGTEELQPGLALKVMGPLDSEATLFQAPSSGANGLLVRFETYADDDHGLRYLGPFSYEAEHPLLNGTVTGSIDSVAEPLIVTAPVTAEEAADNEPVSWFGWGFAGAGALLLVAGIAWPRVRSVWTNRNKTDSS